ncbi:MAG: hypothetical protein K2Z81_11460, partial [Cyanobacteria bacterium]|nr:hypothetical protein [Cyanobacteriota bacterium]
NRALTMYQQYGISRESNRALREAVEHYEEVPPLLLSDAEPPGEEEGPGEDGDINSGDPVLTAVQQSIFAIRKEAVVYTRLSRTAWQETPGARSWLSGFYQARLAVRSGPVFELWKKTMEIAEEELFARKFKKAKNRFRLAFKQAVRLDDEIILSTISYWCLAILAAGPLKDDESIFLQGVELSERIDGPTHILYADYLYLLGCFYVAQQDWKQADTILAKALNVAEHCDEDDALLLSILDKQSFVFDMLSERQSATEARQQRRIVRNRMAARSE